jgi:hypothetical protein
MATTFFLVAVASAGTASAGVASAVVAASLSCSALQAQGWNGHFFSTEREGLVD